MKFPNKNERLITEKSKFTFGRYKGKLVGEVLKYNPGYVVWCIETIEWFTTDTIVEDLAYEGARRKGIIRCGSCDPEQYDWLKEYYEGIWF